MYITIKMIIILKLNCIFKFKILFLNFNVIIVSRNQLAFRDMRNCRRIYRFSVEIFKNRI